MNIDLQYKLYLNQSLKNKPINIIKDLLNDGFFISTSYHNDCYNETDINLSTNNLIDIMKSLDNNANVIYIFKNPVYLNNQPKNNIYYIGWIKFDENDLISDYSYNDFMNDYLKYIA